MTRRRSGWLRRPAWLRRPSWLPPARVTPARIVLTGFVALIALGTLLLALPVARDAPGGHDLEDALFISTSASTVTGLASVDITSFSLFGELVILALVQIGGFGIMTVGSVVALVAAHRVGLRQRILARTEIGAVDIGELRSLIVAIAKITLAVEGTMSAILFIRFWQVGAEDSVPSAAWSGLFHGVSAFNNAGISLYPDSLMSFVDDPVVVLTVSLGFIVGGLGFPIIVEMVRRQRGRVARWSLHTKITLTATAGFLVVGPLVVLVFEWTNPETLGDLDIGGKLLAGWFQGVTPRTAGFNTVDTGALNEPTLLFVTTLMFIGAGPASTSGGIKVTTFAVLAYVLWAEVRGDTEVNAFRRRLPESLIRQALTVALLAIGLVVGTSLVLMASDDLSLTPALFESTSAFGTVGLSTGVTGSIGGFGHLVLVVVMLAGRIGPVTFVTALALRERSREYRYAEERPIIG